jgi:osmotically-inducible protein OsmY
VALDLKQIDLQQVKDIGSDVADRVGRAAKELGTGAGNAARQLTNTADASIRQQLPKRRRGLSPVVLIAGTLAGAIFAYLFDPQQGKARRATLLQWSTARVRQAGRSVGQFSRYSSSTAAAFPQRMVSLRSGQTRSDDDLTLRDRIESEIFRDPEVPKGEINFDVNSGIVTIRGAVDNAFSIATIEKAVFKVPGVSGVENLLHVSGTPAPNKAEARETAG